MHPPAERSAPKRTIAVLGAGYVGLAAAAGFSHLGHTVRIGEADPSRLAALRRGVVPISEPGLADLIRDGAAAGRLEFFGDNARAVEGAAAVFVAVPTPEGEDGAVDLRFVEAALDSIAPNVAPATAIVIKSSIPPGSAEVLTAGLRRRGVPSPLVVNPEFLQEGSALEGVLHPYRVVIGGDDPDAVALVAELHEPLGVPIITTNPASAELTKYAANSYLAMRLTFVNAMAHLAEDVGADVGDVLRGLAHDPRIGDHYLRPGPGYGGSCFPKDVRALVAAASEHGHDLQLLRTVVETNHAQIDRVVNKVVAGLGGSITGAVVGLLGLAFKGGTDDARSSPAVALADRLLAAGARVQAFDPGARVERDGLDQVPDAMSAAKGADALLLATEWPQFADLDLARMRAVMRGRLLVDARNMLDPAAARAAGFDYHGLGR
jgi:UDPglucose 6-dehydrogenase